MKYKDGSTPKFGDIIRWNAYDSDDYKTWTFTGVCKKDHVLYLGGGIDFGLAIGKQYTFEEVIQQSENNDSTDVGISKIGVAMDLVRLLEEI